MSDSKADNPFDMALVRPLLPQLTEADFTVIKAYLDKFSRLLFMLHWNRAKFLGRMSGDEYAEAEHALIELVELCEDALTRYEDKEHVHSC